MEYSNYQITCTNKFMRSRCDINGGIGKVETYITDFGKKEIKKLLPSVGLISHCKLRII